MMTTVLSDLRYAARALRRNPGFALMAIAPIALGIGINTGIFSILESVTLRPLPAPESGRLVSVYQQLRGVKGRFISGAPSMLSFPEYRHYRDHARTLSGLMAYSRSLKVTLAGDSPQQVEGQLVTCNYLDVLRVRPAIGRGFAADCDAPGAQPTVVLSHDLWVRAFNRDPDILRKTITLNRHAFVVVGIAPERFAGTEVIRSRFFAPASTLNLLWPDQPDYTDAGSSWLSLVGRRHDDVGIEEVRAELSVLAARLDREQPGRVTTVTVERATSLSLPEARRDIFAASAVVLAAFALILLIASANVANLLLARGAGRTQEIAIRLAMGASRRRLIQQLLTESLLIALVGGIAGTILAWWSFQALLTLVISSLPAMIPALTINASPNLTALAFALALTVATGVLFGLAPTLRTSKPDVQAAIKQGTGGSGRRTGWLRGTLMSVQVAVCMTLLISAALLLRALHAAQTADPGFEYHDVTVVAFDLPGSGYDDQKAVAFHRQLMERLRELPGVELVAQVSRTPLSPGRTGLMFRLPSEDEWHEIGLNIASTDYFSLIGIPIVRGRAFTENDLSDAARVAIVTEATARRYFPNADPVGQTMLMGLGPGQEVPLQVVGVAGDAQVNRIAETESSYFYLPAAPRSQAGLSVLVRSRATEAAIAPAIHASIRQLDPALAVRVGPLEENLEFWRTVSRLVAGLSGSLSLLALVLSSVGVFSVVSYVVSRRRREVGIRMVLGATRRDVQNMILRQTMQPVAVGMLIGILLAAGVSRVLQGVLFGVSPLDAAAFFGAAVFLTAVAIMASLAPTRRATQIDPVTTLRQE
jgi:predicted permease